MEFVRDPNKYSAPNRGREAPVPPHTRPPEEKPPQTSVETPQKPLKRKWPKIATIVALVVITPSVIYIVAVFAVDLAANKSPVPKSISKQVDFPIYYPDQKKLPAGYTLSKTSFKSPQEGVVVYSVEYSNGKKLVFSVQKKPSSSDLDTFVKNYLPIHRQILTEAGTATVGSIQNQTVVSLPTDDGSWLIVAAPAEAYGTDQLSQALKSLIKD